MVPVKFGVSEQEIREELLQYYDEETVEGMIRAVKRNGMSAWGAFLLREAHFVREMDKPYNLFRLPGVMPMKRSEVNA